jgi:hypothetical protein
MMDRDPPRLLETSGSFATRELLRTALEETAPGSARQRVLSTLGIARADAPAPGASAGVAPNAVASGAPSAVAGAAAVPVSTSSGVFETSAATRSSSAVLRADARGQAATGRRGEGRAERRGEAQPEPATAQGPSGALAAGINATPPPGTMRRVTAAGVAQRMAALQLAAAVLIGILVGKAGHVLITNAQPSSLAAPDAVPNGGAPNGAESTGRANIERASLGRVDIDGASIGAAIDAVSVGALIAHRPLANRPRSREPRAHEARAAASKTRESDRTPSTTNEPLGTASSRARELRPSASRDQDSSKTRSRAHDAFQPASRANERRSVASRPHERLEPTGSKAKPSLESPSRARSFAAHDRRASGPHARAGMACAQVGSPQGREASTPMASPAIARQPRLTAARESPDDWLGEQLVILSRTERSLLAGNRDGALRSFDEYRARFPTGMLDFAMASLRERVAPRFEAFIFP